MPESVELPSYSLVPSAVLQCVRHEQHDEGNGKLPQLEAQGFQTHTYTPQGVTLWPKPVVANAIVVILAMGPPSWWRASVGWKGIARQ